MGSDDSGSDTESVVSSVASGVSKSSSTSSTTYLTGYTPASWYRCSFRTIALILFPLLSLLGGYGTWSLAASNGTFDSLVGLLGQDDPKFPGTENPLLMRYTGFKALDHQLTVLVAFFAPVVDIKNPGLNLFAVWGLGQFGAVWTLMVMESMRTGNKGKAVSFIGFVGLVMQNITLTITAPLWLFAHLLTSPVSKPFPGTHANSVLLVSSLDLKILPISISLSYLLPSILLAVPSPEYFTPETHQRFLALWQAFPLLTVLIHRILYSTTNHLSSYLFPADPNNRPPTALGTSYLHSAKHIYRFVLILCIITHLPILILVLFPASLLPPLSPLDPFASSPLLTLLAQTPSSVFLPSLPSTSQKISGLAEGVQTFLQWDIYIASTAFILWALLLYRNATTEKAMVDPNTSLPKYRELLAGEKRGNRREEREWRKLGFKVVCWGVLAGPVGVVGRLLWERDSIVRLKIKQGL
ncbi:hypothetical protein N431DRAFT_396820 [Stipitochalara longipes BDJ]|nr:hypothetical protein N431DRAFT_396820 [Stipitochalara longipes BDJ]